MHQEINEAIARLQPKYTNESQLVTVIELTKKYISHDVNFKGSAAEQYKQYYQFIMEFASKSTTLNIYMAAEHGYDQYIAQTGELATINAAYIHGMYPLHIAAIKGYVNTIRSLLAKQADPRMRNAQQQLAIHCALFCPITYNPEQIHNKEIIFSILLHLAPDTLLAVDNQGNTIFHYMAKYGLSALLSNIIQEKSDGIFIWNNFRRYPIHEAICNNKLECVQIMLEKQDVIHLTDSDKRTPLHYAALYGNEEIAKCCCNMADDLNVTDSYGKSPIILAIANNNLNVLKIFLEESRINVNLQDGEGRTALHYSAILKKTDAWQLLLKNEDLKLEIRDKHGKTAAEYGDNCFSSDCLAKNNPESATSHKK